MTAKRRKSRAKPKPPPPQAVLELGAPPSDSLGAEAWMHAVLIASMHDVAQDPNLDPAQRRKELRTISAAAAKVMPRARLYEAEQLIKADRAELDRVKARRTAKLEPVPPRTRAGSAP